MGLIMGRKFTVKLTEKELASKIADLVVKHEDYDPVDDPDCWGKPRETFNGDDLAFLLSAQYGVGSVLGYLPERIRKDLSKVEFDTENVEWVEGEAYAGADGIVGIHTLPNGLTYLGFTAGGDWEMPIFAILYFDGKELRGYVPKNGNTWNVKTNKAFGNAEEEEEDLKQFTEQTGILGRWDDFNVGEDAIRADIQGRIEYSGK